MKGDEIAMDAGLNIVEGVRIRLGDSLTDVKNNLTKNNIEYKLHDNGEQENGLNTTIMFMEKHGVELSINNDRIVYIKSNNSNLNYIIELTEDANILFTLNEIKEQIATMFNVNIKNIRIDEFDGDNTRASLSVKDNDGKVVKISLVRGIKNRIYMHTIRLANYAI